MKHKNSSIPILVYKKDTGEFVGKFRSVTNCAQQLDLDVPTIRQILRGKGKSQKGYTFVKETQ